uniref:Ribosomal protein S10 n=1 Tax=Pseudourostyla cristata TaxID=293816 RepID=A0A4P9JLM4_9SPIT|nr:ribosomal protein S10 [Pseudourostyla cristata]
MHKLHLLKFFNNKIQNDKIRLTFVFFSYINPYITKNLKLLLNTNSITSKKLQVKQSYLLLTWFYYLSTNKNLHKNITFFILPKKQKFFTLTKAPMAHKNWSKEQYKFKYFLFKISYGIYFNRVCFNNLNFFLLLILTNKYSFETFETNLFFLKNYTILINVKNKKFFALN